MANDLMESHFFHGLGANLWHGTSPYQIHTPSPTYKTPHAVQEPQPIKRLPISPPSIVILRVLTSSSQSNSVISDLQWIQASLPVRDGGLGIRRESSLALPASLASAASTLSLHDDILTEYAHSNSNFLQSCLADWSSGFSFYWAEAEKYANIGS